MPVTHYTWDPLSDNLLMESDENGDTIATYTNEPGPYGELISQHRDGATSFYHFDGQGNTRALTDENGDVTDTYTYSAFGKEIAKTGSTVNPFGYQGSVGYYANPGTEDLYVRARHYDPSIGRWLSIDPLGFIDGSNSYAYAALNPIGHRDPSGLYFAVSDNVCGPDVTLWFKNLLNKIRATVKKQKVGSYINFIKGIKKSMPFFSTSDCPEGIDCWRSVTVCGQCVEEEVLTDVVRGFVNGSRASAVGDKGLGMAIWHWFRDDVFSRNRISKPEDLAAAIGGARIFLQGGDICESLKGRNYRELQRGYINQGVKAANSNSPTNILVRWNKIHIGPDWENFLYLAWTKTTSGIGGYAGVRGCEPCDDAYSKRVSAVSRTGSIRVIQ